MSKYVIHACPDRMDYVNNYLVPSMQEQGIKEEQIDIRCDKYGRGNLDQCMQIFSVMVGDGGAWHLQDDVLICRDFRERTEAVGEDIVVCGFVWGRDENINNVGYVNPGNMWWSFPCIYIPNHLALECSQWFYTRGRHDPKYTSWLASKRYDDLFFREFLKVYHTEEKVLNMKPCLVDHVDYLIGGSVVNKQRDEDQIRAYWFEDEDLVDELEKKICSNMPEE